jgi:hypothetical protein
MELAGLCWGYRSWLGPSNQIIPHPEYLPRQCAWVRKGMDQRVAEFLQRRRGSESYASFGRKVGLSASTLFRLENCQQSITVQKLEQVLAKLKCTAMDVFPPGS